MLAAQNLTINERLQLTDPVTAFSRPTSWETNGASISPTYLSLIATAQALCGSSADSDRIAVFQSCSHSSQQWPSEHLSMHYLDYMAATQQDDDSLSTADLIAGYERGTADLRTAVADMTPQQILARPIAGKWSTQEVVSHLAGTEIYYTDRMERTIALERPLLIGVDERPYSERLSFQEFDMNEELDLFTALRRHATRVLRMLPPEAWKRTAVHSETGLVTLRQLVLQAVRHVRHHLPFIAEKRAAFGISMETASTGVTGDLR